MRLLADENLAGTRDLVLLDPAESEARIVLTLDADFWQIAVRAQAGAFEEPASLVAA